MLNRSQALAEVLVLVCLVFLTSSPAFGYLDSSSFYIVTQALVAGLAGLVVFSARIKRTLKAIFKRKSP